MKEVELEPAGGVGDEPEEDEIGVSLAGEHRLEIKFEVRLAGEGLVIAEQAKAEAIRDDGPEVTGAAVEELLDEPVGIGGGRTNICGLPAKLVCDACAEFNTVFRLIDVFLYVVNLNLIPG